MGLQTIHVLFPGAPERLSSKDFVNQFLGGVVVGVPISVYWKPARGLAGTGGDFRSAGPPPTVGVSLYCELTWSTPCRKLKLTVSPQTKPEVIQVWDRQGNERL